MTKNSGIESVLWDATVRAQPFRAKIEAAAAGGFTKLTVPIRIYRQEISEGHRAKDLCAMAADQGVSFEFLDGVSSWAPIRCPASAPPWLQTALTSLDVDVNECFDICDALGMKNIVIISAFDRGQLSIEQQVDAFGHFCDQALARGLWVDLEFIPMLGVGDLSDAWDILHKADRRNSGILFDTWHFVRGTPDFALLESIPPGRIVNVQLADAQMAVRGANLWEDAHRFRMFPGEGELPIERILRVLGRTNALRSIGPEVFSEEVVKLQPEEIGRRAARGTAAVATAAGLSVDFRAQN